MRFIKTLLIVAFVLTMAAVSVYADEGIQVAINGNLVNFDDQPPAIVDNRTLVPVRGVFEAMGFNADWEGDTQTATLTRTGYVIAITLDSTAFTTNGVSHQLEVPAQLIGGRTMLPIRAVLESVGYELDWDNNTRTVLITSGETVPVVEIPQPVVVEVTEVVAEVEEEIEEVTADSVYSLEAGTHFRALVLGPTDVPVRLYFAILENNTFEVWSGSPTGDIRSGGTFSIDGSQVTFSQEVVLPSGDAVPEAIEDFVFTIDNADRNDNITRFSIESGTFRWPLPTMPPVTGNGTDANNNPQPRLVFNLV